MFLEEKMSFIEKQVKMLNMLCEKNNRVYCYIVYHSGDHKVERVWVYENFIEHEFVGYIAYNTMERLEWEIYQEQRGDIKHETK